MINLELLYMNDICNHLFVIDKKLKDCYEQYIKSNSIDVNLDFNVNDVEHNRFLSERPSKLQGFLYFNKGEYESLQNYDRLPSLLQYICNIKSLAKEQKALKQEKKYRIQNLIGFEFCDGRLYKVEVDNQEHICKLSFSDVLSYDDKRLLKQEDVEANNIELKFSKVKIFEINREISTKVLDNYIIHNWFTYKNSDETYGFDLFCLTKDGPLCITIVFSDVEVSYFNLTSKSPVT